MKLVFILPIAFLVGCAGASDKDKGEQKTLRDSDGNMHNITMYKDGTASMTSNDFWNKVSKANRDGKLVVMVPEDNPGK